MHGPPAATLLQERVGGEGEGLPLELGHYFVPVSHKNERLTNIMEKNG